MNIAILGAGAVAKTFMSLLASPDSTLTEKNIDIKVKYILDSKGGIFCENGIDPTPFTKEYNINQHQEYNEGVNLASVVGIDLLVDLRNTDMERAPQDFEDCMNILKNGAHLVCGNKGPVVYGYKKLNEFAQDKNVQFLVGCAACAALPSVITAQMGHAGSKIFSFEGVVNGTTNYIISNMENGMTYKDALDKAKAEGIAEKNPDYDTKGIDTAIKTVMLANIIWNSEITLDDASITGIDNLTTEEILEAAQNGKRIKLIGEARISDGKPVVTIAPKAVSKDHLLFPVSEKYKAVVFNSGNLGSVLISGSSSLKGAAAAILRDIVNIYEYYSK